MDERKIKQYKTKNQTLTKKNHYFKTSTKKKKKAKQKQQA
jgi:hypothetical protein